MRTFKIGDWLLEEELNQMCAGARVQYLGALKTRLLAYLAGRAGQVVSRDDLARDVWGGFASDHTITQNIALLRKYLSGDAGQVYLQTVPKRGYRLIAPVSEAVADTAAPTPPIDLANIRALVVDDSDFVRDYLAGALADLGVGQVASAADAEAALRLLESQPFELVLTDVVMGAISGLELARRIRAGDTPLDPFVAIIVMTSFTETDILGSAILLDVNGFLTKPMSHAQLNDKLHQALIEDFPVRPAIAYRHIDVSFVHRFGAASPAAAPPRPEADVSPAPAGRALAVTDLREGMVLAAPLHAGDGELILPAGVALTRTSILRLREIAPVLRGGHVAVLAPN
jgi:DNA-binding response OmpR family regulator